MTESKVLNEYFTLFDKLKDLVVQTEIRTLSDTSEDYFVLYVNFFTKSFIVISCAYLESYLKDISMLVIEEMNLRLKKNRVPHNLIKWCLNKDKAFNKNDYKFEPMEIGLKIDDIDEDISANVYKTISLFKKLGINLESNSDFEEYKDIIGTLVEKRNNIVHHNDDASDISFSDICYDIDIIKKYINLVDGEVASHIDMTYAFQG